MTVPVIESYNTATAATLATDLTLTKPGSVDVGDLLVIVVVNDVKDTATDQYDDSTYKPTGFTLINESGDDTCDCHVAAFYRVATGSEGSTIDVPCVSSAATDETCGWYFRISGVDTSDPINVTGADSNSGLNPTSYDVSGVTTTVDDCLVFCAAAFDGGDGETFVIGGTGWSLHSELSEDAGSGESSSGCIATKTQSTAGATGDCTVDAANSDGVSGFTFAISPPLIMTADLDHALTMSVYMGSVGVGVGELLTPPTGLKATTNDLIANYTVCLTWDLYTGADIDYYSVYINGAYDSDTATGVNIAMITATVLTDVYSVSATDTDGIESDPSDQVSITPVAKKISFSHRPKRPRRNF